MCNFGGGGHEQNRSVRAAGSAEPWPLQFSSESITPMGNISLVLSPKPKGHCKGGNRINTWTRAQHSSKHCVRQGSGPLCNPSQRCQGRSITLSPWSLLQLPCKWPNLLGARGLPSVTLSFAVRRGSGAALALGGAFQGARAGRSGKVSL